MTSLETAGLQVQVPEGWVCCGRPLYDFGMLDTARAYLENVLNTLRPQIEAGVPVVGLEPNCVSVFRDKLIGMMPGKKDAQRLKEKTFTLGEFLHQEAPTARHATSFRKADIPKSGLTMESKVGRRWSAQRSRARVWRWPARCSCDPGALERSL